MPGVRAHVLLGLCCGAAIGLAPPAAPARADQVDDLTRTVERDGSEKARIAAVVALGRLADPRGFRPLARALADPSPLVRGVAASALGSLGDPRAIPSLERALADDEELVRARAREALARVRVAAPVMPASAAPPAMPTKARFAPREAPRRAALQVAVNRMGFKTAAGGSRELPGRMRDLVVRQLAEEPGFTVAAPGDGAELVVDGAITRLTRETRGGYVEVTCEVRLTVSNASGSLLSIVSGGATVQEARRSFSKQREPSLQAEALDNAVRGMHANLVGFLARHTSR